MKRTTANLLLLTAGAVWGMGFVAQQTAMEDIAPLVFVGARFILAGLVVTPFALIERTKLKGKVDSFTSPKITGALILLGSVFFLGMALQQFGLLTTSVTNSGFLTALYVIMVPIFMLIFMHHRPSPLVWPSAILAITGIFLLSGGSLEHLTAGDWLTIACAAIWAWHVILTGTVGALTKSPVAMACIQFYVAGILALFFQLVSLLTPYPQEMPTLNALYGAAPELIYASVFAGGLAFTLQAVGQRHTSAAAAAILLSTESLFAALFGALFLGNIIAPVGYLGCAMIFSAILITELAPIYANRNRPQT